MAGISTPTKSSLCLVICVVTFASASGAEPREADGRIQNADWTESGDDGAVIEQTQFGGFFPQYFDSPAVTNVPRQSAPTTAQRSTQRLSAGTPATQRRQRLARAPDMLGDTFLPPLALFSVPQNIVQGIQANSPLSVAGGSARSKIGEHNKPLPVDRVYFNYNHFHNAVQRQVFNGFGETVNQSANVDRFTMGVERTIMDGDTSLELRLPLTNFPDLDTTLPAFGTGGRFKSHTGTVGNLSLIAKRALINAEDLVVSGGLGIEFPTGADGSVLNGTTLFNVENESLFLQPFLAATLDNGRVFVHSFLQVDVGLTDNPLTVSNVAIPGPPVGIGEIANQTLIHWDTSTGIWLAKSDDDTGITGIAAIVEFHLTSAVSSAANLKGSVPTSDGPLNFELQSPGGRFTATYITAGIHTEIAKDRTIRVAGVFPLRNGINKFFDGELVVQFGGRY